MAHDREFWRASKLIHQQIFAGNRVAVVYDGWMTVHVGGTDLTSMIKLSDISVFRVKIIVMFDHQRAVWDK